MRAKEIFAMMLEYFGVTQKKVAEITGYPELSIGQKINVRETIKVNEFLDIMDKMGVGVYFFDAGDKRTRITKDDPVARWEMPADSVLILYQRGELEVKEITRAILKVKGYTIQRLEDLVGAYRQELEYKILRRGSISCKEYFEVLDIVGIVPVFFLKETGEELSKAVDEKLRKSEHFRVVGTSDRKQYDTQKSKFICSSFFADGKHEYGPDGKAQDLFQDQDGMYFIADYDKTSADKAKVRALPVNVALAFIERYKK